MGSFQEPVMFNRTAQNHGQTHTESRSEHQQSFGKIARAINKFVGASRNAVEEVSNVVTSKISSTGPAVTTIVTDFVEGTAGVTNATLGIADDLTEAKAMDNVIMNEMDN